jgi:putative hemolysin
MKKPAIAMSLLVVLVGCATKYTHPDYSEQKWAADYAFCSAQGGQASGANDPYSTRRDRTIRDCLIGKGWSKQ